MHETRLSSTEFSPTPAILWAIQQDPMSLKVFISGKNMFCDHMELN
jgi:hypothetical protein